MLTEDSVKKRKERKMKEVMDDSIHSIDFEIQHERTNDESSPAMPGTSPSLVGAAKPPRLYMYEPEQGVDLRGGTYNIFMDFTSSVDTSNVCR